jgi:hypothetical protein
MSDTPVERLLLGDLPSMWFSLSPPPENRPKVFEMTQLRAITINDISNTRLWPHLLISALAHLTLDSLTDLDLGYSTLVEDQGSHMLPAYPSEADYRKLCLPSLIKLTLRNLPVELLTYFLASLPDELPALEAFVAQVSSATTKSPGKVVLNPREGYLPISMPRLRCLRIPEGSESKMLLRWISFQGPLDAFYSSGSR